MKMKLFACFALASWCVAAQVPQNGMVSDAKGNIYIAIHAPAKMMYDGFSLPVSAKKSTYVIKVDSNGDLVAVSQADGAATIAGPLVYQQDTLYFGQAAIDSRGENLGEIVLTKMNNELTYRSTVTYPLGGNARPVAVSYAANRWSFVYATESKEKVNYTFAGLSHVYAEKWTKPLPAYHVSNMFLHEGENLICGTFMNAFRFDGKEAKSAGADMFVLNTTDVGGAFKMLRHTASGTILTAYVGQRDEDFWVAGALLVPRENGLNATVVYAGLVKASLDSEHLFMAQGEATSEATALCAGSDGAFVAGNFRGSLELENVDAVATETDKSNDVFVMKLGTDGTVGWLRSYGKGEADEAIALAAMPDGGVVLAYAEGTSGYANGFSLNRPAPKSGVIKLMRFDDAGNVVWERILQTENP